MIPFPVGDRADWPVSKVIVIIGAGIVSLVRHRLLDEFIIEVPVAVQIDKPVPPVQDTIDPLTAD